MLVKVFSVKGDTSIFYVSGLLCKRAKGRVCGVHRTSCEADGSLTEVLFPRWYPINEFDCENGNIVWKNQSWLTLSINLGNSSVRIFCCFIADLGEGMLVYICL